MAGNGQQELTLEQKMFLKRTDDFNKELLKLQEEFQLVIVPYIEMTQHGIIPNLRFMDKKQFEKLTAQGSSKEAAGISAKPQK